METSFTGLHLLLWFLLINTTPQLGRALDSMELGSSLTPSSKPLQSSSSVFLLYFRSPPALATAASASNPSNLFLAISFAFASGGPPAWVANRKTAVSASANLTFLPNGDLRLSDPSISSSPLWSSGTGDMGVVRAQLLDSGNLVLLNNRSAYVWQSFLFPTDTLLPTQNFTSKLVSSERAGLFNPGNFSLNFSDTGGLQLSSTSDPSYWIDWAPITSFWFDLPESNIIRLHGSGLTINKTIFSDVYNESSSAYRLTLDVDGNLRMYAWYAASSDWKSIWMAFTDVCSRVKGLCGDYGICVYSPQPTCVCPPGFIVQDPTLLSGGCYRNVSINSNCDTTSIKFLEMRSVDYPFNDLFYFRNTSIDECKRNCSFNCTCMVAVFWQSGEYGRCWIKELVRNGNQIASQQHKVFIKMSASDPSVTSSVENRAANWSAQALYPPPRANTGSTNHTVNSSSRSKGLSVTVLSILVGAQALCIAAACIAIVKSRRKLRYVRLHGDLETVSGAPLVFSYQEMEAATENFRHKLGSGGFGNVYKGNLQDGKLVAVKQLEGVSQQEQQFRAEIATLGRVHHVNLLRLVGFCSEGTHRLLVYEFMENGSLDQILFEKGDDSAQTSALDWGTRFQICLGIARGIRYLHEECLDCILHCDIKPQNILLDGSFTAKVADFGLAYLFTRNHTVKMSTIRGTRGYLAPEWVLNLPITAKADVYSYGMLVMEIVSGRKNYLHTESATMDADDKWYFPIWAYGKEVQEVIDPRMDAASTDYTQVESVLKVGFACSQGDINARPSMARVVQMLEGILPIPEAPPPSLFPHDLQPKHPTLPSSSNDPSSSSRVPPSPHRVAETSSSSNFSIIAADPTRNLRPHAS